MTDDEAVQAFWKHPATKKILGDLVDVAFRLKTSTKGCLYLESNRIIGGREVMIVICIDGHAHLSGACAQHGDHQNAIDPLDVN